MEKLKMVIMNMKNYHIIKNPSEKIIIINYMKEKGIQINIINFSKKDMMFMIIK